MSKVYEYDKVVRGYKLVGELKAADFLVETVYDKFNFDNPPSSEPYCKVVLENAETKDPTAIVEAHDPYTGTPQEIAQKLEKATCEQYLAHSPASITQPLIWYLLRAFGKKLGYKVE